MAARGGEGSKKSEDSFQGHRVRLRDALLGLKQMRDDGLLDDTEYKEKKSELLSATPLAPLAPPTPPRAANSKPARSPRSSSPTRPSPARKKPRAAYEQKKELKQGSILFAWKGNPHFRQGMFTTKVTRNNATGSFVLGQMTCEKEGVE